MYPLFSRRPVKVKVDLSVEADWNTPKGRDSGLMYARTLHLIRSIANRQERRVGETYTKEGFHAAWLKHQEGEIQEVGTRLNGLLQMLLARSLRAVGAIAMSKTAVRLLEAEANAQQ